MFQKTVSFKNENPRGGARRSFDAVGPFGLQNPRRLTLRVDFGVIPQPLVVIGILDQTSANRIHDDVIPKLLKIPFARHAVKGFVEPDSSCAIQSFVDFVN